MRDSGNNFRRVFVALLMAMTVLGCIVTFASRNGDHSDRTSATEDTGSFLVNDGKAADAREGADGDASQDAESSVAAKVTMPEDEAPAPYEAIEQSDMTEDDSEAEKTIEREEDRLTIAEGSNYVPDEVLVTVSTDATVEEVNALLAQTDSVVAREVSIEEIERGWIKLEVSEGTSVEDAMNDLSSAEVIENAQPNYIYYALLGDEDDLRERLDATMTPQAVEPEGSVGEEDSSTTAAVEDEAPEGHVSDEEQDGDGKVPTDGSTASSNTDGGDVTSEVEGEVAEEDPAASDATAGDEFMGVSSGSDDVAQGGEGALEQGDEEPGLQALSTDLVTPNDKYVDKQWALASMHVLEAWALVRCEHAVGVAVIDQGMDPTHEDLVGNVVDTYDAVEKEESIPFTNNHGTAVSGVVSAVADNEIGVAGVSFNADLMLVNAMKPDLSTRTEYLLEAFEYVINHADAHNIRVINLSIGGAIRSPIENWSDRQLENAVDNAYAKGIVTVAAAANAGSSYNDGTLAEVPFYEYPGDLPKIVSVINLKRSGNTVVRASDSNYNVDGQTAKNISAPGTEILSTYNYNRYNTDLTGSGTLNGTSLAAPQVTGVLALEFAANPQLSAKEAVDILYSTAYESSKAPDGLYDSSMTLAENYKNYGWGEVNAFEAVKVAKGVAVAGELPDISQLDVPEPKVTGATRVPVGATADYTVKNGSIKIKSGGSYAKLEGNTLTGLKKGTVKLGVYDKNGKERSTHTVSIYATSGTWTIASKLNLTYVVDVRGASINNMGNVIIYESNGKNNQVWLLEHQSDGAFVIRSGKSGKVLDVSGGSVSSGANVCQNALGTKACQRWTMQVATDNSIIFVNKNSGKVLEVSANSAANSKNVRQATKTGATRQRWVLKSVKADIGTVFDGIYRISSSMNKGYVIEVYRKSKANGANINLYKWNGGDNQRWRIQYLGKGVYKITNVNSLRSIDVKGAKLSSSVNIAQWTWKNTGNQRWNLTSNADGSYSIVRAGTAWAVAVKGGKAKNGANVYQYARKSSTSQKWLLTQF